MMKDNIREATLEELENEYRALGEKIQKKKQDEEERKKAELAKAKEIRKQELDEAREFYYNLLHEYLKDYHSYEGFYTDDSTPLSKIFELFM